MQPSNGAAGHRQRMIVLDEGIGDVVLGQGLGAIAFREKPAMIAKSSWRDHQKPRKWRLFYLYEEPLSKRINELSVAKIKQPTE